MAVLVFIMWQDQFVSRFAFKSKRILYIYWISIQLALVSSNDHFTSPLSGNPRCPVSSFLKYLSKLNPMNLYLWQRPKASFKHHACEDDPVWYENAAVGHNSLGEMMTNMSKLARLSRIYTNNCIRGTYVAILDSLVDDYPLITTLVSLPAPQKYQHILPRDPCDERPTMVSVNGKYRASSPDETATSRCNDSQHSLSAFSAVTSREQAHLAKSSINSSHPSHTSSNGLSSHTTNSPISEKETEFKPTNPVELPMLGMRFYSSQKEMQSSLAAYRLSQLQACSSHHLRSPLHLSVRNNEGSYCLPHASLAPVGSGNKYSGHTGSKVVYCQTSPTMASSSSHTLVSSRKLDRPLIFQKYTENTVIKETSTAFCFGNV